MTKDVLYESLEKLAVHFGSVSMQEKEDFYTHLKGYSDGEMAQAKVDAERKALAEYPPIMRGRSMTEKEIHARITGTKFFGM